MPYNSLDKALQLWIGSVKLWNKLSYQMPKFTLFPEK